MDCGGGVATGRDATSLTRFGAGGGSSLSKDMMLDVLRGSEGFARPPPTGPGVLDCGGGAWGG